MRPRVLQRRHFRGGGTSGTPTPSSTLSGQASSGASSSSVNGALKPGQTRGDCVGGAGPGFATYHAALHSNPSVYAALNNNPINYPLPSLPADGQVVFELIIFAYSMVAMLLQHLHLYRSVFWLPHSYNTEAVNWYLIEWNIISFATLFLGRRIIWLCIKGLITLITPSNWSQSFIIVARSLASFAILMNLFYIIYVILLKYPLVNLFCLIYPVVLYFVLFGLSGEPFLELIPITSQGKMKLQVDRSGVFRINSPMGCSSSSTCSSSMSSNPESVRSEVAMLKTDFNMRIKQAAFNSVCSAYYTTFVPLSFTTGYLYYEISWVSRHVILVWVGCFTLYACQLFPIAYTHLMHKSSVCALGFWSKIDGRVSHNFYHQWSPSLFWSKGVIVRHGKDLYRAEGIVNAAEPGNNSHNRFSWLFSDVSFPALVLLVIQTGLVVAQHVSLSLSVFWYMLISEAILLFANYYACFKSFRNFYVLSKVQCCEESFLKGVEEHLN